jgi:hypothetical protein
MEAMRDSTNDMEHAEKLRARMREEGYLLVRGVIDPAFIRKVKSDVLEALRQAEWISADGSLRPLINGDEDPRHWAAFGGVQALESFHQMAFDTRLTAIMTALLGEDMYPWPGKAPYMMWPEHLGGTHAKPHQEGVRSSENVLSTWISIGSTPMRQGGLAVLPRTQDLGYLPHYGYGKYDFGPEWVTTGFEPGDIVVFHNFTIHGSLPNQTDELRLSCSFKWQSARYPAPDDAGVPVRYPRVPGWESLTKGWSSKQWITAPTNTASANSLPAGQDTGGVPSDRLSAPV